MNQNIFSLGKLMNRNFLKKKCGGGGSFGKISKSTVVLFCYSIREGGGWVVIFRNFEKSAYVPSKKYLIDCAASCTVLARIFLIQVLIRRLRASTQFLAYTCVASTPK